MTNTASTAYDEFALLMEAEGQHSYGENITIAQHSLLTAARAREQGASDALVASCLLHDVGHFLAEADDEFGLHDHGDIGGDWVAERFGDRVAGPVRLHIEAKRYLCATDLEYHARLSPASQHTLAHQGGPMSAAEAARFATNPHLTDALTLRRWEDDFGKLEGQHVPKLVDFRGLLDRLDQLAR